MNGVDFVLLPDVAELAKMVHMDEAFCHLAVAFTEVHITDCAVVPIELKTSGPGDWIPFVGVNQDFAEGAFNQGALSSSLICHLRTTFAETAGFQCGGYFGPQRPHELALTGALARGEYGPPLELAFR